MKASEMVKMLTYTIKAKGDFTIMAKVKDYTKKQREPVYGSYANESIDGLFEVPKIGKYGYIEFIREDSESS